MSGQRFGLVVKLSILSGGVAVALLSPFVGRYFRRQASQLVNQADQRNQSQPELALVDYRLANLLNPFGRTEVSRLAHAYESSGQADQAISTWQRLPLKESGLEIARLQSSSGNNKAALITLEQLLSDQKTVTVLLAKAKVEIELGRFDQAVKTTNSAASYGLTEPKTQLILGLAQQLDQKPDQAKQTLAIMKPSPQTSKLKAALASDLGLGEELYNQGVFGQAEKILSKHLKDEGPEPYNLVARIKLGRQPLTRSNLDQTAQLLETSLKLRPDQRDTRALIIKVYRQLGNVAKVNEHIALLSELERLSKASATP